jgi:CAAX prenyl protease-like protein
MNNSSTSAVLVSPALARIVPFAVFIAFVILQSVADERLRSFGMDTRWLYPARTVAVAVLLLAFWRHYHELRDFSGLTRQRIGSALAAGIVVFLLWINLESFAWTQLGRPSRFDPTHADGSGFDWALVAFRIAGLAVIVPVMEELFWRSYLLRWIDRQDFMSADPRKASARAVVVCSVLFALEHGYWLAGLLAGLVYSVLYMRGGNLWLPLIGHATTNAALAGWILATDQWQFW